MKSLFIVILTSILFIFNINNVNSQNKDSFFENVAITNIIAVEQEAKTFYYELTIEDFSGKEILPKGFGLAGYTFADNGEFNDKTKGDGIYSSIETKSLNYLKSNPIKYTIVHDQSFKFMSQLLSNGKRAIISCTFVPCGCPCSNGINCGACAQFGWTCWRLTECDIGF